MSKCPMCSRDVPVLFDHITIDCLTMEDLTDEQIAAEVRKSECQEEVDGR